MVEVVVCVNRNPRCNLWAALGRCDEDVTSAASMKKHCCLACEEKALKKKKEAASVAGGGEIPQLCVDDVSYLELCSIYVQLRYCNSSDQRHRKFALLFCCRSCELGGELPGEL